MLSSQRGLAICVYPELHSYTDKVMTKQFYNQSFIEKLNVL